MEKKRSQAISSDILAGAFLFILGFLMIFTLAYRGENDLSDLRQEGDILPVQFMASDKEGDSIAFIIDSKVNKDKLRDISQYEYSELKANLNIKHEFAMYFEDENGNLIDMTDDIGKTCIGSPDATLNGVPCG